MVEECTEEAPCDQRNLVDECYWGSRLPPHEGAPTDENMRFTPAVVGNDRIEAKLYGTNASVIRAADHEGGASTSGPGWPLPGGGDAERQDEVGFVTLAPGGGHGIAGSANFRTVELFAKAVAR